jgi:hypothetical protein
VRTDVVSPDSRDNKSEPHDLFGEANDDPLRAFVDFIKARRS